jgi:DNA polymerase-3 subunit alpha
MRRMLKEARPNRFEDLIALNAMFRPGPMENIPTYCRRKHGQEPVTYPHPYSRACSVDLRRHGLPGAGDAGRPDTRRLLAWRRRLLRKAMGKKKPEEMAKHRTIFRKGAAEKGITAGHCR